MTNRSFEGRHVVITGGSSGVGAELVRRVTEQGVGRLTVLDRQEPSDSAVEYLKVDLADPASLDAAAAAIDSPVDVLFNNAGVAATLPSRTVMSVNFLAPRRLMARLLPAMPTGGAIVNTASTAGGNWMTHQKEIAELLAIEEWAAALDWVDDHGEVAADIYAFSKECLQALTVFAAKETMANGVRLNAVCPGVIETPLLADFKATISEPVLDWMTAQGNGRRATPGEIAAILAFVGSPEASYLHGTNIVADGGFTAALAAGQVDFASYPG
jgi:NAD(P)-dependent dehydrogenase (short-subunit alcohol dehydrogenase family)